MSRDTELTYTITLTALDGHVTGTGRKLGEKKSRRGAYTPCACTPFDITGSVDVDGDSLKVSFIEKGEQSTTQLKLDRNWVGLWEGGFTSTAARPNATVTSIGNASLSAF